MQTKYYKAAKPAVREVEKVFCRALIEELDVEQISRVMTTYVRIRDREETLKPSPEWADEALYSEIVGVPADEKDPTDTEEEANV